MNKLVYLGVVLAVTLSGCAPAASAPVTATVDAGCATTCSIGEAIAVTPRQSMEELAAGFDVTVVWSDNPEVNCGASMGTGEGGCYLPSWPDMVWISTGMDDIATRDVLLHEIGHVLQARNGEPFDECGAEAFAHSQGAPLDLYDCP